ncbi:MAG TPA: hypothetical protein VLX44_18755 [Xanthobacteraceae bacterium]|nr:hypothetical protein [Xanthobacteraceae bacterium]
MAVAEQPGYDALEAARVRLESPDGAPAQSDVAVTADLTLEAELFDLVDKSVRSRTTRSPEIRIDQSQRVPVAGGSRSRGVFLASLLGASAASLGLAWVVIASLGSPFDLTSITKLGAHRAVDQQAAPPPLPAQTAIASAPVAEAKADGQQTGRPLARVPDQKAQQPAPAKLREPAAAKLPEPAGAKSPGSAPVKSPDGPDLFSSTAMTRWKPALGSKAPTPSAGRHTAPHPHPPKMVAIPPQPEPRITTPVPETRPTTIPGWTLREIVNGTAVVDGPGGSFRVAQGDSVPGVGRVLAIFRWGNRSIVATSQGLISTP